MRLGAEMLKALGEKRQAAGNLGGAARAITLADQADAAAAELELGR